ncbi:MAG: hypothetical protein M3295_06525 [Chloroflexota bacterium]|nr:hypothetical protein [Chloroflexota bacterium]
MSSRARLAIGAGVTLLSIVVVAIVLLRGRSDATAVEPTATPTALATSPPPTASHASSTPSAGASASTRPTRSGGDDELDPETARVFARIEEEVIDIRGLERADIGRPDILSRDELADELIADFEHDYSADERHADNVTLRAMGLLDADEDIAELQLALLEGRILGFYDEDERRMAIVSDAGLTAEAQRTYAHEYTHALQDQAFDLNSLDLDVEGDDDGATARLAVVEGDAMITMYQWAATYLRPDAAAPGDSGGDDAPPVEIPGFLEQSLFFPYTYGTDFVAALHDQRGYDAVDAAFGDPPESTEQIVHPNDYFDDEQPVDVSLPDLAAALGEDWEQVESTPIGEAFLTTTLDDIGADRGSAEAAAAGWGGDHLVVAAGPDDAFALAWRLAWDTPADAAEFASLYGSLATDLGVPARVIDLDDGTVLVAQASSADLVERVVEIAGG